MPIATGELKRDFIAVDERVTVRQVRDQVAATGNKWTYVVVRFNNGQYAVLRLNELIQVLQQQGDVLTPDMLEKPLRDVPNLLVPRAGEAVEQASMGIGRARQLLGRMPGRRLVVLAEGEVIGLLAVESRSLQPDVDLAWLGESPSYEISEPEPPRPKAWKAYWGLKRKR